MKHMIRTAATAFLLLATLIGAELRAQLVPASPSYRSTIFFINFGVFGNNQHTTGNCVIDGAFFALHGVVPAGGQAPYGEMVLLKSHPNYNEIVATLLTAKAAGLQVEVYLIQGAYACPQIPTVGSVWLIG